jgi:hypothetical protein
MKQHPFEVMADDQQEQICDRIICCRAEGEGVEAGSVTEPSAAVSQAPVGVLAAVLAAFLAAVAFAPV